MPQQGSMGAGPDYIYGRAMARGMAPIMAQESTAAMLQAVIQHKNYMDRLQARKDVMTDVEKLRSPAALMDRARRMEGFGDEAQRLLAGAQASGNQGAILDATRAARRGAEKRQVTNLARAGQSAELAASERTGEYQMWEMEQQKQEQIQQMLFNMYGQQMEAQKYRVGGEAAKAAAPHAIAHGFLAPG